MDFPKGFIWGAATAAYQIEGAAQEDGRGPGIWDTFCRIPGKIKNGDTGDIACDHYHRLDEDLGLIAGLVPNYRFSISWPRVLPEGRGRVNEPGLDFYDRLVDGLLARNVTPWVTLFHWDLPQALQDRGGWANRDILGWFSDYAELMARRLGDRVNNWIILNEPSVYSWMGHGVGINAPGLADRDGFLQCVHHMNMAVGQTYRALKSENAAFRIGSAYTLMPVRGERPDTNPENVALMDAFWNGHFYDPLLKGTYPEITASYLAPFIREGDMNIVRADLDFVGIQHYDAIEVRRNSAYIFDTFFGDKPAHTPKTAMGWSIDPSNFYECLTGFKKRYGDIPLIVTENGIALEDSIDSNGQCPDPRRIDFLRDYIGTLARAMKDGVNVRGYFVWSLMDNFEWGEGYRPRFGLIHVDYARDRRRTPKSSYEWYATLVKTGKIAMTNNI